MSVKMSGMVWDLKVDKDEKLVMLAYADHADHNGFSIFPAVSTVAEKTGYSERSVQRITRILEEKGYLIPDGQGPKGTNKWRIPHEGGAILSPLDVGGDMGGEKGVTTTTERGDIAVSPESSLTVIKPSSTDGDKSAFRLYENNIGLLTSIIRDKMLDAIDNYPNQWILDAINEAVVHNARSWAYIDKILLNWEKRGKSKSSNPADKQSEIERELAKRGIRDVSEVLEDQK